MTTHQAMTIRDYFQARLQRAPTVNRLKPSAGSGSGPDVFKNLLRNKEATAGPEVNTGLTVADYRAAAIAVHRSPAVQLSPASDRVDSDSNPLKRISSAAAQESSACQPETIAKTADQDNPPSQKDQPPTDRKRLIDDSIAKAARKHNLSPRLIRAVIRAESNFQVDALSPAGAQGLMQLMPATARELGVNNSFDIEQNIDGGSRYLRRMLDRYSGNLRQALAAYNAGPGNVDKYGGRVPFAETRQYVDRVLKFSSRTV